MSLLSNIEHGDSNEYARVRVSVKPITTLQSAFKPESDVSAGRRNYESCLELERIARGLVVVTNNTDHNWSIYFIQLISKHFMGSELVVVKVP